MIITINPKNPQPRLIRRVVEVLKEGGVVGYPTDTIYGIGCDLFNPEAIRRIHRLKKAAEVSWIVCNALDTASAL